MSKTEYRENDYFNDSDLFLFELNDGFTFESKCHYSKGYWWTSDYLLNYKCTSIKAIKK